MRVFCQHGHPRAEMLRADERFVCAAEPCGITVDDDHVEAVEDTVPPAMWLLTHPILVVYADERGDRREVIESTVS